MGTLKRIIGKMFDNMRINIIYQGLAVVCLYYIVVQNSYLFLFQ